MSQKASSIFHFLRGAVRGVYGVEDFRSLKFAVIGASQVGQDLLMSLCLDGLDLKFQENKISDYARSISICKKIEFYKEEPVDVLIDLTKDVMKVGEKSFIISKIEDENPYVQGIHSFYL